MENREDDDAFAPLVLSLLNYGDQKKVWSLMDRQGPQEIMARLRGKGDWAVQDFIASRYTADPLLAARKVLEASLRRGVNLVHYWHGAYPPQLREIHCPPLMLYARGTLRNHAAVAVVGTRKADERSRIISRRLASELSCNGFSIVSGMALGVDREAHFGGLEGPGGTVGVMANGIDIPYPRSNADLFDAIEKSPRSALVSEYPPGIKAGKWTFVRRNRIISGLARAIVVVMAGERSGALITARYAAEQNREVFACPGHAYNDDYRGCHELIRNGAILLSHTEDVLAELGRLPFMSTTMPDGRENNAVMPAGGFFEVKRPCYDENSIEGRILSVLSVGDRHIDAVIAALGAPPGEVLRAISVMELDGVIAMRGNRLWPLPSS